MYVCRHLLLPLGFPQWKLRLPANIRRKRQKHQNSLSFSRMALNLYLLSMFLCMSVCMYFICVSAALLIVYAWIYLIIVGLLSVIRLKTPTVNSSCPHTYVYTYIQTYICIYQHRNLKCLIAQLNQTMCLFICLCSAIFTRTYCHI